MPRSRVTVRRLMAGVVVAAIFLGAVRWIVVMRDRSAEYERWAWQFVEYDEGPGCGKSFPNKGWRMGQRI
jgi:hypothetical protein